MIKLLFLIGAGIALVQGNCGPCPTPPLFFTELNCTPILRRGDCCPISWSCPEWGNEDPTKCHFGGKSYEPGTELDNREGCDAPCVCRKFGDETAKWQCTHIDCPEFLGGGPRLQPGCKFSYKPDQCCASQNEQICESNRDTLHKCTHRGDEFVKGEKFTPRDEKCYTCACDESFKDDTTVLSNSKNCRKYSCGYETLYKDRVLEKCAPVYIGDEQCCPIDWICPEQLPTPQIIPTKSTSTLGTCKFGTLELKHFEGLETNNKCRKCSCQVPPLLACTQDPDCN